MATPSSRRRFVDTPRTSTTSRRSPRAPPNNLRRVVGLGRVGAGLRINVDDDGAVVCCHRA